MPCIAPTHNYASFISEDYCAFDRPEVPPCPEDGLATGDHPSLFTGIVGTPVCFRKLYSECTSKLLEPQAYISANVIECDGNTKHKKAKFTARVNILVARDLSY